MTKRHIERLIALLIIFICATSVHAQALITVDTISDAGTTTGNCELREAVLAAETNTSVDGCAAGSASGPDKIVFAPALAGQTIALAGILNFSGGAVIIDAQTRPIMLQTSLGNDVMDIVGTDVTLRGLDVYATGSGNGVTLISGSIRADNTTIQGRLGINAFGNPSTVTLNNSTVASTEINALSDIAIRSGAGNNLVINNSTVVATVGKGLDVSSSTGTSNVYSSIIVGATPVSGTLSGSTGGTVQATSTANAGLAASLANNGGPTRTFALLSGAAIDSGDCTNAVYPHFDQRYYFNPATNSRSVGSGCDAGAFEKDAQDLLADRVFADDFEL
jgi:hypothetical protein